MADSKKTKKAAATPAAKPAPEAASAAALKAATTPAEKAATKPSAKKQAKPAAAARAPSTPVIDTSLAAQAAAKMIKHGLASSNTSSSGAAAERPESASFRQLKDSLNKPTGGGVATFLQNTAPQKKSSSLPFGGPNQQLRRNQTFGADVNRSGVPRRTGG